MGRSNGTESATSRGTGQVQSAFFLVGAPGTGKTKIVEELASRFDLKLAFRYEPVTNLTYAVGTTADYRIELKIALNRTLQELKQPTIATHSLIDSLAYSAFAVARAKDFESVSIGTAERLVLTMTIIAQILQDSFRYEHLFFLKGDFDSEEDFEQYELQSMLQMIMDSYGMNYSIIDANEHAADSIADVLKGYLG